MNNILFGWENRIAGAVLTAGSAAPELDIGNLQGDQGAAAEAWQTPAGVVTAAGGAWFVADAGAALLWRAFLLARTNLTAAAVVRWRVGAAEAVFEAAPVVALDFTTPTPSSMAAWSTTRGGAGTGEASYYDAAGSLVTAGGSAWRVSHDPATLARRGLVVEPARTNAVVNPRAEGAVAGSPGTLPTGWTVTTGGGLSYAVLGSGTENGQEYLDLRITGTSVGGGFGNVAIYPAGGGGAAALTGQVWSYSHFHKLVALPAGSAPTAVMFLAELTAASVSVRQGQLTATQPVVVSRLSSQPNTFTMPLSGGATVAKLLPVTTYYFDAGAVDATLRYSLPQLEQGNFATLPIRPPVGAPAASTRPGDAGSVALAGGWGTLGGTLYVEQLSIGVTASAVEAGAVSVDDGTANNAARLRSVGGATPYLDGIVRNGGAAVADLANVPAIFGQAQRSALAFATDSYAAACDGVLAGTDSAGTMPTTNRLAIIAGERGAFIRAIRLYAARLTDGQIVALSGTGSTLDATLLGYDSGALAGGVVPGFRQAVHAAPAPVTGRYLRCDIDDPGNPDGFLNIPLAFGGPAWQPVHNFGYASQLAPEAPAETVTTRGGQEFVAPRFWRRGLQLSMPLVRTDEIWASLDRFLRAAARGGNVLVVPNPDSTDIARETVFGRVADPGSIGYANAFGRWRQWAGRIAERL